MRAVILALRARRIRFERPAGSGSMVCKTCRYEAEDGDQHLRLFRNLRAWALEDSAEWMPR